MSEGIPFSRRRVDWPIVVFFAVNLLFITYIVDLEQLVIADPAHFTYPVWPPAPMVDLIHSYGRTFDPLLMARPVWWKVTILLDSVFFGPFYVFALYAFVRGRTWIRVPSLLYSAMLFTNVVIILGEELFGPVAAPQPWVVIALNLPWLLMPLYIVARMGRKADPFASGVAR
jgi:hypothetical protein